MKLIDKYEHPYTRVISFSVEKGSSEVVYGSDPTTPVTPKTVTITYTWTATKAEWSAKVEGRCPVGHRKQRATVNIWSDSDTTLEWFRLAVEEQAPSEWRAILETLKEGGS